MKLNTTTVVIVNYKTPRLTCDCLDSLAAEREVLANFSVVIVDNHSNDGSAESIQAHINHHRWDWAKVLPRSVNDGFAAGNNAAILAALASDETAEFFWLLNPDTLVRRGALQELLTYLQQHPEVGIAGSRLENLDGTPQRSAFRFPGILSEFERASRTGPVSWVLSKWIVAPPVQEHTYIVDWLSGASMLVRKKVFDEIGLLDSNFFLYFEETDVFWRAKKKGWLSAYVPSSRVVHLVGQSSGIDTGKITVKRVPTYLLASRKRYLEKSHGKVYARLCDVSWLSGHLLLELRRRLAWRKSDDPPYLVRDFVRSMLS
jgi:N-acetylglucosaminyl-diphospho-decaprenol L-rhamnosyltransferase